MDTDVMAYDETMKRCSWIGKLSTLILRLDSIEHEAFYIWHLPQIPPLLCLRLSNSTGGYNCHVGIIPSVPLGPQTGLEN